MTFEPLTSPLGDGYLVDAQQFDAYGNAVGPVVLVAPQGFLPSVATSADGVVLDTYQFGTGIFLQAYNAAPTPLGPEPVGTSFGFNSVVSANSPGVAPLTTGGFVVVYQDQNSNSWAQIYGYDRQPVGAAFEVAAGATQPVVASQSNGTFLVAWTTGTEIMGALYDNQGDLLGGPFDMSGGPRRCRCWIRRSTRCRMAATRWRTDRSAGRLRIASGDHSAVRRRGQRGRIGGVADLRADQSSGAAENRGAGGGVVRLHHRHGRGRRDRRRLCQRSPVGRRQRRHRGPIPDGYVERRHDANNLNGPGVGRQRRRHAGGRAGRHPRRRQCGRGVERGILHRGNLVGVSVRCCRRPARFVGGQFTIETALPSNSPSSQLALSALPDGGFLVTYDSGNTSLASQRFDASGDEIGAPVLMTGSGQAGAVTTVLSDGTLMLLSDSSPIGRRDDHRRGVRGAADPDELDRAVGYRRLATPGNWDVDVAPDSGHAMQFGLANGGTITGTATAASASFTGARSLGAVNATVDLTQGLTDQSALRIDRRHLDRRRTGDDRSGGGCFVSVCPVAPRWRSKAPRSAPARIRPER